MEKFLFPGGSFTGSALDSMFKPVAPSLDQTTTAEARQFKPKTITWRDRPDRNTIRSAFATYNSLRDPARSDYQPLASKLPRVDIIDFLYAVATASVEFWSVDRVIGEHVLNQPLHKHVTRLDDVKNYWGPKSWKDDQAVITKLYDSVLKWSPVIYFRLTTGRCICLDGAHRSVACSLAGWKSLAVCVIGYPMVDVPEFEPKTSDEGQTFASAHAPLLWLANASRSLEIADQLRTKNAERKRETQEGQALDAAASALQGDRDASIVVQFSGPQVFDDVVSGEASDMPELVD